MCEEEKNEAEMDAVKKELEICRLRLAGALMASEGANPLIFKEKDVLPEIRDCPTINSILDLYAELQKYKCALADCIVENEVLLHENRDLSNLLDSKL
jgi:hypothetical protein